MEREADPQAPVAPGAARRSWRIEGGRALAGRVVPPADKSIAHRALFLSAIAEGESTIAPIPAGRDNGSTARALAQLGVSITRAGDHLRVLGLGTPRAFRSPAEPVDCENSGTTMRVLAGLLAPSTLTVELVGDASLSARPMERLRVLEQLGVRLSSRAGAGPLRPPLVVEGAGLALAGGEVRLAVASAQVKTALLVAGLFARGPVAVTEPLRSRDHTERMLRALGATITERPEPEGPATIVVHPLTAPLRATHHAVPPDPSSAAFWLAAQLLTGSSALHVQQLTNPTRTGFLAALRRLGAEVSLGPEESASGEPVAWVSVGPGALEPDRVVDTERVVELAGQETLDALDEVPVLAAVAAFRPGRTVIRDAGELRVKESDRLRRTAELITAFGGVVVERADGLELHGTGARPRAATVDVGDDHRLALTAAVLALAAEGTSTLHGVEIAEVSYPGFAAELAGVGAAITERGES